MESLDGECPYAVLGVPENATDAEIRKAYLKAALKAHPDKNRNNPNAADIFHRLVSANDLLTDEEAKTAYDRVLKLKNAAKMRDLELTAEQRKAKQDLERRENEFKRRRTAGGDAKRRLEAEIIRLREHGQQRLIEEQERLLKQEGDAAAAVVAAREKDGGHSADSLTDLKIKWKTKGFKAPNGGYSADTLDSLYRKYGPVTIVMGKKDGKAIVTFVTAEDAETALQFEQGLVANPLSECAWVSGNSAAPDGHGSAPFSVPSDDLDALEAEAFANLRRAAEAVSA
eukprot:m.419076 g.419076  ORF g.419076 m.419076 type:complete len:285 (+) comp31274_c0_seq1:261-1115(+)